MKKSFNFLSIFLAILFTSAFSSDSFGQVCRVSRDSLIAGQGTTGYSDYVYDGAGRLAQVTITDSGSFSSQRAYVNQFDGFGNVTKTEYFEYNPSAQLKRRISYTYTSGKVTSIYTEDFNQIWSTTYNITYNGNDISSIVLTAVVDTPDFNGSFINMNWASGNVTTLTLVIGTDTVELQATYDNKDNINSYLLNTEGATGLFEAANVNNLVTAALVNNETIFGNSFNAGTLALDRDYTYNANDDVETMTENPALFDQQTRTTQYIWDCSVGIFTPSAVSRMNIFPNPATDIISLEQGNFKGVVKIFDVSGKEISRQIISEQLSSLDISKLNAGAYYIEIIDGNKIQRGKILKN